jgi:FG-GAP repeat protein
MLQDALRKRRCALRLPALLVAAAPPLAAQEYAVWTSPGAFQGSAFGASVANVGDLDADGVDDLADVRVAFVDIISGASGAPLFGFFTFNPTSPSSLLDIAGVGDANGDGVPDIAVGVAGTGVFNDGTVALHSGASGASLWTVFGAIFETFGRAVVGPGDLNGDGVPDVAVTGASVVRALSGTNGAVLYAVPGAPGVVGPFDRSLAVAPDRNGDGVAELLVGSPGQQPFGTPAGLVGLLSGASGAVLQTYLPAAGAPGFDFGFSVASAGDLDGDGISDVAVGTPQAPLIFPPAPGGSGLVQVFSGASGAVLFASAGGASDDLYGFSLVAPGDLDGDGVPDLAVGAPQRFNLATSGPGYTRVLSGAGGAPILVASGAALDDGFGSSLISGDWNSDGVRDLAVGAPSANPPGLPDAGEVRAISFVGIPPTGTVLGSGCPGTGGLVPRISISGGTPDSGGNPQIRIHLTSARPSAPALWILGFSSTSWLGIPLPADLAVLSMPGCFLRVSADVLIPTLTSAAGRASFPHPTPPDPALSGLTVFNQWFVVDPGPAVFPGVTTAGLALGIL